MAEPGDGPDPSRISDLPSLGRELDLLRRHAARGTGKAKASLDDIARRLAIPRSTLHTYLAARTLAPPDVLDAVVIALGARPDQLRGWAEAWFRVSAAVDKHASSDDTRSRVRPRQLPADTGGFVGRTSQLETLDSQSGWPHARSSGSMPVVVLAGPGGVGKTALAVHWAHRAIARFSDGQLFCDLNGYGPGAPVPPEQVLRDFLRALGVAAENIAADVHSAASQFRSVVAGRRLLVLLDNARSAQQVRHLLPGAPGSMVVVTSRSRLRGLVVRDGAAAVGINGLGAAEARGLVTGRIGADAVAVSATQFEELIRYCAGLPLALLLVAERIRRDGIESLDSLLAELADERSRLRALRADEDDSATNLLTVFAWSYDALASDAARLFMLIGVQAGADISIDAAAALSAQTYTDTKMLATALADLHLLDAVATDRYTAHDLLRSFAHQLSKPDADVAEAMTRLKSYYLSVAALACDALAPTGEPEVRPNVAISEHARRAFSDRASATSWFDDEIVNLLSFARLYDEELTSYLSPILARYLTTCGRQQDAIDLHRRAASWAHATQDVPAEARALYNLGFACLRNGRADEATGHLERALALAKRVGGRETERRALNVLGLNAWQDGRFEQAQSHLHRALTLAEELSFPDGEAIALNNLGILNGKLDRNIEAADCFRQAADISARTGYTIGEAMALGNLGLILVRSGQHLSAKPVLERGLELAQATGNRNGEGRVLSSLGLAELRLGLVEAARQHLERAWQIAQDTGDKMEMPYLRNSLGELCRSSHEIDQAMEHHLAALEGARADGDRYEQARAHDGLADAYEGDPSRAEEHRCAAAAARAELAAV